MVTPVRPHDRVGRVVVTLGVVVGAVGVLVDLGWALDLDRVVRVAPGLARMRVPTATSLVGVGVAIVLSTLAEPRARRTVEVLGLVGAATAVVGLALPGYVSVATAVALLAWWIGVLLLPLTSPWPSQASAVVCLLVAGTTLLGFAYGVDSLYAVRPFARIAVHTAVTLALAAAALLLLRPGEGLARVFAGTSEGARAARRALPVAVVGPVLCGGVVVRGIDDGLWDGRMAVALLVTALVVSLVTLAGLQAARVHQIEQRRVGAERAYDVTREALAERDSVAEELRRANADLADFSAAMAHDLRTPLTVIKGYAELLEGRVDDRDEAWLARIDSAADRGTHLISDILSFARFGSDPHFTDDVDLATLVDEVGDERLAAAHRRARVDVVGRLPVVPGDRGLLGLLVGNLIGNALKYVPADRDVVVTVDSVLEAGTGDPVLRVSDNGDAIAPADRDRIFEMFQRGGEVDQTPGSGVGLAICRRVAELHGGRIWLERGNDGGARFCVRLTGTHRLS